MRSKQNRQGREILRKVMDLRENSETKGVMVSSRSRSRHSGNERVRDVGSQEMTVRFGIPDLKVFKVEWFQVLRRSKVQPWL